MKVGDLIKLKNPPSSGPWSDPNKIYLVTGMTENTVRVHERPGGRFKTDYEIVSASR